MRRRPTAANHSTSQASRSNRCTIARGRPSKSRSGRNAASAIAAGACSAISPLSISCRIFRRSACFARASCVWALLMAIAAWSAKLWSRATSASVNARGVGLPTESTPMTFPATRSGTARPAMIPRAAFRSRISGFSSNRASLRISGVHIGRASTAARPMRPTPAGTTSWFPAYSLARPPSAMALSVPSGWRSRMAEPCTPSRPSTLSAIRSPTVVRSRVSLTSRATRASSSDSRWRRTTSACSSAPVAASARAASSWRSRFLTASRSRAISASGVGVEASRPSIRSGSSQALEQLRAARLVPLGPDRRPLVLIVASPLLELGATQPLGPPATHHVESRRPQSPGRALGRVLDVERAERLVDGTPEVGQSRSGLDGMRELHQQVVAALLHVWNETELPDLDARLLLRVPNRLLDLVEVELLAGDADHVASLADERDFGGALVKAADFDDVVEVVAVEPVAAAQDDVVAFAVPELVGEQGWRRRIVDAALGDELEECPVHGQHARGRAILEGHREAALARDQPEIAQRDVCAVIRPQAAGEHPGIATEPARHQREPGPARPGAGRAQRLLEECRARSIRAQACLELAPGICRRRGAVAVDLEGRDAEDAVVDRPDDLLRAARRRVGQADERARIRRSDRGHVARQGQPHRDEVARVVIGDQRGCVREDVLAPHEP